MITREGLHKSAGYDIMGEKTGVRKLITNAVISTVENAGKWFAICKRMHPDQHDIMSIENNQGQTIGQFLAGEYSESMYRVGIYKYLLAEFLCYYEAPTIIHSRDEYATRASYNKFLATSNIRVIAAWLGISEEDALKEYGYRVNDALLDSDSIDFPYVKLYTSKDGQRKVTKPRKDLDLSIAGTRVIPLFALKVGVDSLYKLASQDFYDVTFLKDGGSKRTVNITFSLPKLREVYKDEGRLRDQWELQYDGNFLESKNLERGYIRVIEVGTNLANGATRSINYARIIGFKQAEPDLTYINIDLDSVVETFKSYVEGSTINTDDIVAMLDMFEVGKERKYAGKLITNNRELINWVDSEVMLESTPFIKKLALFMIGNPQWFDGYTGEEKVFSGSTSKNISIGDLLDDIDDLDLM